MKGLTKFERKVFSLVKMIPKGKITTYKEIAKALGKEKLWRQVGKALSLNPFLKKIPCHRVVCSDGKIGGYQLGKLKKVEILKKEGIKIKGEKIKNFDKIIFRFK